jgi:hypothetical protein
MLAKDFEFFPASLAQPSDYLDHRAHHAFILLGHLGFDDIEQLAKSCNLDAVVIL